MTKITKLPLTFKQTVNNFVNSDNFKKTLGLLLIAHILPIILFLFHFITPMTILQSYGIAWGINGGILSVILFYITVQWCFDN